MKHLYTIKVYWVISLTMLLSLNISASSSTHISVSHDPTGRLEILDLLNNDSCQTFTNISGNGIFLHHRNGFYWLKIEPARQNSGTQPQWVYIPSTIIDSAEVFFVQPKNGLEVYGYTQLKEYSSLAGMDKRLAFPFYPTGKEKLTIYIKLRIDQAGLIFVKPLPESLFYKAQANNNLYTGLLVALVVIFCVLLMVYTRQPLPMQTDLMIFILLISSITVLMYNNVLAPFSAWFNISDALSLVSLISILLALQVAFFYASFRHMPIFRPYKPLVVVMLFGFMLLAIFPWFAGPYFSFNWVLLSGVAFLGIASYLSGKLMLKKLKPASNLFMAFGTALSAVGLFAFTIWESNGIAVVPAWAEQELLTGYLLLPFIQAVGLLRSSYLRKEKSLRFFESAYREIRTQKNNLTIKNLDLQAQIVKQEKKQAESHQRFEATLRHIDHQKSIIEEKNKDIMDGIRYAHRIQNSLLSHRERMKEQLPSSFVLFQPKDIVSGDFFFCAPIKTKGEKKGEKVLLAAIDCAGHGVSGALLAVIGNLMLSNIVTEGLIESPAEILYELDARLNHIIDNQQSDYPLNHGMDIALCIIDKFEKQLVYAGARRPLMLFQKGVLHEIKGSKSSVGVNLTASNKVFFDTDITYQNGDSFYLFTDGYVDQFAEKGGRKFMVSQFRELLTEIQAMKPEQQEQRLEHAINSWKGIDKQTDDILVMGVQV